MFRIMIGETDYDNYFGELNGRNMYDCSDEEMYDVFMSDDSNCVGPSSEPKKSKVKPAVWKLKDGTTMLVTDMTDKHLENSINYCRRLGNTKDELILEKEQARRKRLATKTERSITKPCQFCGSVMKVEPHYVDGDDSCVVLTEYRLTCECGAMGPIINSEMGYGR